MPGHAHTLYKRNVISNWNAMRIEQANLEFEDIELLQAAVRAFNWDHRNTSRKCALKLNPSGIHEITVEDNGNLIPFGLFEIGTYIGYRQMYTNYRIRLGGWRKSFHRTIFEGDFYPQEEMMPLMLNGADGITLQLKSATGYDSGIETIRPFLSQEDFQGITEFSQFREIKHPNATDYKTWQNQKINYSIVGKYLLLFGVDIRYTPAYCRIDMETVFEINKPENDF